MININERLKPKRQKKGFPEIFKAIQILTPAFVFCENRLLSRLSLLLNVAEQVTCQILYPLKACSTYEVLRMISHKVQGFAASSLFEARLAREIIGEEKLVHFTIPGLKPDEIKVISELCSHISFNSLSQFERYHGKIAGNCQSGIRINTELPFIKDDRYNPCRRGSKVGVPLSALCQIIDNNFKQLKCINGLLFHTNCESEQFEHLLETVKLLDKKISRLLDQVSWINLGGGYLFDETTDWKPFLEAVDLLKERYSLEVIFEPGKGIVGEAGFLVSTVLDIIERDGKKIAVLDTTVNHTPEVFEYQYRPSVMQESSNGHYKYILAGASCLAGDLFGEYSFGKPLAIGSRIVFEDMGAYTLVKAHMFNGINLPPIYLLRINGELELIKEFDFNNYLSNCGADRYVIV